MAELPDLIALTDGDPEWTWEVCIVCGSTETAHRGLYVTAVPTDRWQVVRVAWCAGDACQADRIASADNVLVNAASETQGAPS